MPGSAETREHARPEPEALALDLGSRLLRWGARLLPVKSHRLRLERPIVSFTFDDVPLSGATTGARILEEGGARGTYYVATGLALGAGGGAALGYAGPSEIQALAARGHEIASHAHSHRNVEGLSGAELAAELDESRARLLEIVPDLALRNFAYPFGGVTPARKQDVARRFRSARGVFTGVNRGWADLALLKAVELYDAKLDSGGAAWWVGEAARRRGWLIFLTHDVADPPSAYGASPGLLRAAIAAARGAGCEILTVDAALDRIGA